MNEFLIDGLLIYYMQRNMLLNDLILLLDNFVLWLDKFIRLLNEFIRLLGLLNEPRLLQNEFISY